MDKQSLAFIEEHLKSIIEDYNESKIYHESTSLKYIPMSTNDIEAIKMILNSLIR